MLLPSVIFDAIVACSKDSLQNIAKIISKYDRAKAESFLAACKHLDFDTANSILDETVKALTGEESVSYALTLFAEKFTELSPELGHKVSKAISVVDKVKIINSHRDRIMPRIEAALKREERNR